MARTVSRGTGSRVQSEIAVQPWVTGQLAVDMVRGAHRMAWSTAEACLHLYEAILAGLVELHPDHQHIRDHIAGALERWPTNREAGLVYPFAGMEFWSQPVVSGEQ